MDGAVFEIIKELEEIQQLNERSLLNKRIKVECGCYVVLLMSSTFTVAIVLSASW